MCLLHVAGVSSCQLSQYEPLFLIPYLHTSQEKHGEFYYRLTEDTLLCTQNTLPGFESLAKLVRSGNRILIWITGFLPSEAVNAHNNASVQNRLCGQREQKEDKNQLDQEDRDRVLSWP